MNIEEYLLWFTENHASFQRHFDGELMFNIWYNANGWQTGYVYIEDYEGAYFFRNLRGENISILAALNESFIQTVKLRQKLFIIETELENVVKFQEDESYTAISLGRQDGLSVIPMIFKEFTWSLNWNKGEKDSALFKYERGRLLYRSHQYKFIYPAISQEMMERLNA